MKKSVLGFAALGVLNVAAYAQSSVTLYGIVDVAVRRDSDWTAGKARIAEVSGMVNTSRWGFRGTEDLGDGMKANFKLEGGFGVDTGAQSESASLFDRRATVGLSGKWGRLDVGRDMTFSWQYTPVYDPLGGVLATPTPTSHSAGRAGLLVNGLMFVTNNPYNNGKLRDNNIKYEYSAPNGLLIGLDYSFGETAGDNSKRSGRQVALGYLTNDINVISSFDVLRDANERQQRIVVVGGNFKASEQIKVTVGHAVLTADALFAPTSNAVSNPIANYASTFGVAEGGKIKVASTGVGADYKAGGRVTLTAAVYNTRVSGDGIAANDYNTYAFVAKYALSKQTLVYAAVDYQTATVNGGQMTQSGKRTNNGLTTGIQTRF
ncbi:porin [Massilia sp. METH4]|uniref:porin n=1 Tax=Massilia sp. METH4 TaxID=3123041 RepID=UPI0030CF0E13